MIKSYSNLISDINDGYVSSIILIPVRREVIVYYTDGRKETVPIFYNDQNILRTAENNNIPLEVKDIRSEQAAASLISNFAFFVIIIVAITLLIRKSSKIVNNTFNFRNLSGKERVNSNIQTRFDDVAGINEAKEELEEIVRFLKEPDKLKKLGARIPKGILLVGSPGTGKTLLAKAIAGEADVPFFSIAASEFVELFVGVGASRVRDLFRKAKDNSPCIIFIDEIDSIGRQRGAGIGLGNDEREQTLNQLLTEMDGFVDNSGIIILAATNRPDVLDSALMRPGRFDRSIYISLPDKKGRADILSVHSRSLPLAENVCLTEWAKRTIGFTGADLKNLLNESAIVCAQNNDTLITSFNIEKAYEKITLGLSNKQLVGDKQLRLIAYHQVSKAIVSTLISDTDDIDKITILPTSRFSGGYTRFIPSEEDGLLTKSYLKSKLTVILSSRAAEILVYGKNEITQGTSLDLDDVNKIARQMVTKFGFSALGPISFQAESNDIFLGRSIISNKTDYAQITNKAIDKEVFALAKDSLKVAKDILNRYRLAMDEIVNILIEEETIKYERFLELFNKYNPN